MLATSTTSRDQVSQLSTKKLEEYLSRLLDKPVSVDGVEALGDVSEEGAVKRYGYGTPLKITCQLPESTRHFVLETVAPGPFGHEGMADRAQILLAAHRSFNRLPCHARSIDAGAFLEDDSLISVGDSREFFLLMEFIEGSEYSHDLERIRDRGRIDAEDRRRCGVLSEYLAGIHERKGDDEELYIRRLRELVGHSECVLGLTDSYSANDPIFTPALLREIEKKCIDWRWRLKGRAYRLCQVHGDYHPWNILFQSDGKFRVLDRARGEWGEAADDLVALSLNYVFFSLQATGRVEGPLLELHERFWRRYLDWTGDYEVLQCVAPFISFRVLVMASLLWYPDSSRSLRKALQNLIVNVLAADEFDPGEINRYCEKS